MANIFSRITLIGKQRTNAHNTFLLICLVFGSIFVLSTPLLWGADETTQLGRAYQVSEGRVKAKFLGDSQGAGYGGSVPSSFLNLIYYVNYNINNHTHENIYGAGEIDSQKEYDTLASAKIGPPAATYAFSNTAPYSPLPYLPSALGLRIGILLGMDTGNTIYLARFFDLLFFTLAIYVSLRVLRASKTKWIVFSVALLPMTLFQASIISADDVTNAVCILFVALCIKAMIAKADPARSEKALLILSALSMPLLKPTYFPLELLILLIPNARFSDRLKTAATIKVVLLGASLVILVGWAAVTHNMTDAIRLAVPGTVWLTIHPSLQEHFLKHHVVAFFGAVIRTFVINDTVYFNQFFGLLGFDYVQVPGISIILSFISLLLSVGLIESFTPKISRAKMAILLSSIGGSFIVMMLTFYITLTSVGAGTIGGLQGRYFLPLTVPILLALALLLPQIRFKATAGTYRQVTGLIVVAVITSLTFALLKLHYFTFG